MPIRLPKEHPDPRSLRGMLWYSIMIIVFLIVLCGAYLHGAASESNRYNSQASLNNLLKKGVGSEENHEIPPSSVNAKAPKSLEKGEDGDEPKADKSLSDGDSGDNNVREPNSNKRSENGPGVEITTAPTPIPAPPPTFNVSLEQMEDAVKEGPKYLKAAWAAVKAGYLNPEDDAVVPAMVIPLFHDAKELADLLTSIEVPVRAFEFTWNSNNEEMGRMLDVLKTIPFGIHIHHHPENIGFSGAVNSGIVHANLTLDNPPCRWNFIVNADTFFPGSSLRKFAERINTAKLYESHGLVYGPRQDHFAFVITRAAVENAGLMDETFYPGYMEDIDYHWRVRLSGLPQEITKINFIHKQSVNMKKPGTGNYKQMLARAANGWEYGWQKWGNYGVGDIEKATPPSGFTTPFNIPGAPLSLWRIDPGHRECIRTGNGPTHVASKTCWYNGTGLYNHVDFPHGEQLTENLVRPMRSGALSKNKAVTKKDRRG